jgi:hypothetical protein
VPGIGGKTFGFDITKVSEINIPRLASGGIATKSMLANIGEAGAEAVIPLSKLADWFSPLDEILDAVLEIKITVIKIFDDCIVSLGGLKEAADKIFSRLDGLEIPENRFNIPPPNGNSYGIIPPHVLSLIAQRGQQEYNSVDYSDKLDRIISALDGANELSTILIDAVREGKNIKIDIDGRTLIDVVTNGQNKDAFATRGWRNL